MQWVVRISFAPRLHAIQLACRSMQTKIRLSDRKEILEFFPVPLLFVSRENLWDFLRFPRLVFPVGCCGTTTGNSDILNALWAKILEIRDVDFLFVTSLLISESYSEYNFPTRWPKVGRFCTLIMTMFTLVILYSLLMTIIISSLHAGRWAHLLITEWMHIYEFILHHQIPS